MEKKAFTELKELLTQNLAGQEEINARLDENELKRKELEESFGTALEIFKGNTNDPGQRSAADAFVRAQILKASPTSAEKTRERYGRLVRRGYRSMKIDDERREGMALWLSGCITNDGQKMLAACTGYGLHFNGRLVSKAVLAEGAGATGGFLVPDEMAAEILKIAEEQAIYRPRATVRTLQRDIMLLNSRANAVSVEWVAEGVAPAGDPNPTWAQLSITVKKALFILTSSTELFEDANVDVLADLNDQIGEAMAKEEDRLFFEGDVGGLTDPFNGLRFTSGLEELDNTHPFLGDTVTSGKGIFTSAIALLETRELASAWWYFHPKELAWLMTLSTSATDERPLWLPGANIQAGVPPTLYGYPFATTDTILRNRTQVVADKTSWYFGNLRHSTIGDRTGMAIDQSIHDKFREDQISIRVRKRTAFGVQFPSALVRIIDFDTSSNAA